MPRRQGRPKIVLAAEATGGGVGRHVLDLAEGLPGQGFDVLLVHSTRRIGDGFDERITRHREFGYATATFDAERAPGVRDIPAALALRRAIRAFGRADVLHGHSSKGGALARIARWGRAGRVVYTPHAWYTQNPELGNPARQVYRLVERGLSTVTDRIVSVSRDEVAHAVQLGIAPGKLVLIENGIEPWPVAELERTRAAARAALGIGLDDVVVGFLGRLVDQKAPEIALHAFRRLAHARPSLRLVLVGDGPKSASVRDLLTELGLGDVVRWIPTARGRDMIPAFDVFMLTSRYEGFPYVLLEALNGGCAIVSTRVGGAVDCVGDGENGALVDAVDADAIAARVLALAECPARLRAAREQSRLRSRLFSLDRMISKTADLYRSIHEPT
jgi:glycosyltransferase involved in cell wall biosynthesis